MSAMNQEPLAEAAEVLGAPIEFSTVGAISAGDRRAVVDLLEKVLASFDEPVTHISVRMEHDANRNRVRPTTVRAMIDFGGGAIRGHVTAETTRAAIRLRVQVRHGHERRKAQQHRGANSGAGEWRHGDLRVERPPYFPRPIEDRQVVRHKTVAPGASTVEEALFDVELMDYDFYLFTDITTDADAFVVRSSGNGDPARVQHLGGGDDAIDLEGVVVDGRPAPLLDLAAAKEQLDMTEDARLFFRDSEPGRGHVLYRRFDGHYGMIVPADED